MDFDKENVRGGGNIMKSPGGPLKAQNFDSGLQEDMEHEMKRLRRELDDLYVVVENKENDLRMSAQIGKKLLDENAALVQKLDGIHDDYSTRIESLEQEKHDFKIQLSKQGTNMKINQGLEQENKELSATVDEFKEKYDMAKSNHGVEVRELKDLMEKKNNELSQAELREQQLEAKVARYEEQIQQLQTRLLEQRNNNQNGIEDHYIELKDKYTTMEAEFEETKRLLNDKTDEIARLQLDMSAITRSSQHAAEELSELTARFESTSNALADAKKEMLQLQSQLEDSLLQNSQAAMMAGTSLFSEVEDKRIMLEKTVLQLKLRNETLTKSLAMASQQRHQLQNRCQMLLQMRGSKADTSKMRRLEQALSQAKGDLMEMSRRISTLERERASMDARLRDHHAAFGSGDDTSGYVDYLQQCVDEAKDEMKKFEDQLRTKTLQQMAECSKLRECESQLYQMEGRVEQMSMENMKLHMKIDELKLQVSSKVTKKEEQVEPAKPKKEYVFDSSKRPEQKEITIQEEEDALPAASEPLADNLADELQEIEHDNVGSQDGQTDQEPSEATAELEEDVAEEDITEEEEEETPETTNTKPQRKVINIRSGEKGQNECNQQ